jgi:hypothetical protein
MPIDENKEENAKNIPFLVMGLFFAVFGLVVFAAIFATSQFRGRFVNGLCGVIFMLISAGSLLKYRSNIKKYKNRIK